MRAARRIITQVLAGRNELLTELREAEVAAQ
jgi:ArsR family transcriptional regulator